MGTLNNRCRIVIIIGTQKGTISSTTTHVGLGLGVQEFKVHAKEFIHVSFGLRASSIGFRV